MKCEMIESRDRNQQIKNKHMKAFNFYKGERSYEEVDIIIDSPVDFKQAAKDALRIKAGRITLQVISKKNFIKMKKMAGRDKDMLDIKEINLIR